LVEVLWLLKELLDFPAGLSDLPKKLEVTGNSYLKENVPALEPLDRIAYRIAYCFERSELENLRDEWNKKILKKELRFK